MRAHTRSLREEISQFHRQGLRPVIFVLNNSGYLIERMLCKDPVIVYNDVAQWNYAELPHALGRDDWFTAKVRTGDERVRHPAAGAEAAREHQDAVRPVVVTQPSDFIAARTARTYDRALARPGISKSDDKTGRPASMARPYQ